jgi:hypothetical protein
MGGAADEDEEKAAAAAAEADEAAGVECKNWLLSDCRNVIPVHPFRFFRGVADANASPSQASQAVLKSSALLRQPSSEAEWSDDEATPRPGAVDLEPAEVLAAKAAAKAKAIADAKAAVAAEALTRAVPCAGSDRQLVHTWRLLQRVHETFYASAKSATAKVPPPPPALPPSLCCSQHMHTHTHTYSPHLHHIHTPISIHTPCRIARIYIHSCADCADGEQRRGGCGGDQAPIHPAGCACRLHRYL